MKKVVNGNGGRTQKKRTTGVVTATQKHEKQQGGSGEKNAATLNGGHRRPVHPKGCTKKGGTRGQEDKG